jgi:hypothetical protein
LDNRAAKIAKEQPRQRHKDRMLGTYVDLKRDGRGWIRPCALDAGWAREAIQDTINDYANAVGNSYWLELLKNKTMQLSIPEARLIVRHRPKNLDIPALPRLP